jgi:hypothetical protein
MVKTIRFLFACTIGFLLIICALVGCYNGTVTFPTITTTTKTTTRQTATISQTTPASNTTSTFEQKRSDVFQYITAFNVIENNFDDAVSKIIFPTAINNTTDLDNWNAAEINLITLFDVAINSLVELKPSSLETATGIHVQQARLLYQSQRSAEKAYRDAINTGIQTDIDLKWNELITLDSAASSLNRATEQLMLQYNISDSEVSYRFRGI